ncbi:hypothetical protein H1230_18265 [Paenibacillus sp. 19GGS1-52]|uniref:hypothetical protein n=1 Tax=Paenibacillus sp. 19GGS1-52 TaxID=2758563 RepID=UPI001EFA9BC3|nr:hypothetical protein [Paenibacillus sp. 19GGS1-52]ULO05064.1 hypothetical protein H1230_18265 [Paenibacillus sp. 19GGS1-52]
MKVLKNIFKFILISVVVSKMYGYLQDAKQKNEPFVFNKAMGYSICIGAAKSLTVEPEKAIFPGADSETVQAIGDDQFRMIVNFKLEGRASSANAHCDRVAHLLRTLSGRHSFLLG